MTEIPTPHDQQPSAEIEPTPATIYSLAVELGITESEDLTRLRISLTKPDDASFPLRKYFTEPGDILSPEAARQALVEFIDGLHTLVEAYEDPTAYQKAQLGALLATATLRHDMGDLKDYFSDLNDAAEVAYQLVEQGMAQPEVLELIDAEIERVWEIFHPN